MGFKALKGSKSYLSFEIDTKTWKKLKKDPEFKLDLIMPCCDSKAIIKNSVLGLQYFSHSPGSNCSVREESESHLMLKKHIYLLLKKQGYYTEIEKTINFNDYYVRADVYSEINNQKIAFEIQVSNQSLETTEERTKKYTDNNIIVVWLNLFKNRSYNYKKFNINQDFSKMYQVVFKEQTFHVEQSKEFSFNIPNNTCLLDQFILKKINDTFDVDNISIQGDDLISNIESNKYELYKNIKINNIDFYNTKIMINRKGEDYKETLKIKYCKGFINKSFYVDIDIKALKILSDEQIKTKYDLTDSNNLNGLNHKNETNKKSTPSTTELKKNCIYEIICALKANKFKYEENKNIDNNIIDIFVNGEFIDMAIFLSFYEDIPTKKSLNICEQKDIAIIIIDLHSSFKYYSKNKTVIEYHPAQYYRATTTKVNSFYDVINPLLKDSKNYPFDKINSIDIKDFMRKDNDIIIFDKNSVENVIFDTEVIDDFPKLPIKEIKEEILFKNYYKEGIIKYPFILILDHSEIKLL